LLPLAMADDDLGLPGRVLTITSGRGPIRTEALVSQLGPLLLCCLLDWTLD